MRGFGGHTSMSGLYLREIKDLKMVKEVTKEWVNIIIQRDFIKL